MGSRSDAESPHQPDRLTDGLLKTFTRPGCLIALRTKAEAKLLNDVQTTEAYITEIPLKSASAVLKCVQYTLRSIVLLTSRTELSTVLYENLNLSI